MPPEATNGAEPTQKPSARVASSVVFVSDLSRSVDFYRDVFGCEVAVQESTAALMLAPGGFQLYLVAIGAETQHPSGGVGVQYLMWATDSDDDLRRFEAALRRHSCYVDTRFADGVSFAEGRDPDGIRVVIAHPDPERLPRRSLDARLYGW